MSRCGKWMGWGGRSRCGPDLTRQQEAFRSSIHGAMGSQLWVLGGAVTRQNLLGAKLRKREGQGVWDRHARGRQKLGATGSCSLLRDPESWHQLSAPTLTLGKSEGNWCSSLQKKHRDPLHTKLGITLKEREGRSLTFTLTQPQSSTGLRFHLLR